MKIDATDAIEPYMHMLLKLLTRPPHAIGLIIPGFKQDHDIVYPEPYGALFSLAIRVYMFWRNTYVTIAPIINGDALRIIGYVVAFTMFNIEKDNQHYMFTMAYVVTEKPLRFKVGKEEKESIVDEKLLNALHTLHSLAVALRWIEDSGLIGLLMKPTKLTKDPAE